MTICESFKQSRPILSTGFVYSKPSTYQ